MLGVLGARKTPRFRGSQYSSQSRWALPVATFDPKIIKPELSASNGDEAGHRICAVAGTTKAVQNVLTAARTNAEDGSQAVRAADK